MCYCSHCSAHLLLVIASSVRTRHELFADEYSPMNTARRSASSQYSGAGRPSSNHDRRQNQNQKQKQKQRKRQQLNQQKSRVTGDDDNDDNDDDDDIGGCANGLDKISTSPGTSENTCRRVISVHSDTVVPHARDDLETNSCSARTRYKKLVLVAMHRAGGTVC